MNTEYNGYNMPQETFPEKTQNAKKQNKGLGWKILFIILFVMSVVANFFMLILLLATVAIFSPASQDGYHEKTLIPGPIANKIAVIRIEGIINAEMSEEISQQIKTIKDDKNVKALIIRTITPGGGIAASDQINNEIKNFKNQTEKPVIAFMQTLATSGGYYTSAACDKIIAEPTAITGSIGVIMGHFVLQDLFEEKLGIKSVVFKSGERKNWPTSFEPVTQDQIQYLNEKLITPAYERFVNIVADGRENLTYKQAKTLADGSIYNADEALTNGLIDQIGYFDQAVNMAKTLAGIDNARVVEYKRPFSLENFFGAESVLKFDKDTIYNMTTPELMYIWDAALKI